MTKTLSSITVMAGLEPATQPARVSAPNDSLVLALDGRVALRFAALPGHDEVN